MEEMDKVLYELLEKVREKPALYIGEKSLTKLRPFLSGAVVALHLVNGFDNWSFLKGFQEWVQMRYDILDTHHWSDIIRFESFTEGEAFDTFYRLYDTFMQLDPQERAYDVLVQKLERRRAAQYAYLESVREPKA